MKKSDLQSNVDSIVIQNPCAAKWSEMDGETAIRFCGQCKKNVHNLSDMTPEEVVRTLEKRRAEPTCVFMRRRKDGSVIIDNCPAILRETRNRMRAYASAAFLILVAALPASVSAQELVGTNSSINYQEAANFATQYNSLRTMTYIATGAATAIAFVLALFLPFQKRRGKNLKDAAMEILALACLPVLVHLIGGWLLDSITMHPLGGP